MPMMTMTTRKPMLPPPLDLVAARTCGSTAMVIGSFRRSSDAQERHHTTWGRRRRRQGTRCTAVSGIGFAREPLPPSPGTPPGSARTLRTVWVREGDTSVLAIEDDADIRQLLRALLGREGYVVSEAATGRDGLRAFHEERPDLVILDVGLPDLDGWQVLERIRDMSDAPVLVLTARSAERDKVRGLNAGADDYLTKPFSRVELLARLQAIRRRQVAGSSPRAVFDDGVIR